MAQSGSSAAAWRKERSASKYQKPCNWPDALVEELLGFRTRVRDGKVHVAGAAHQIGLLPRPFVEGLAVHRVAGRRATGVRRGLWLGWPRRRPAGLASVLTFPSAPGRFAAYWRAADRGGQRDGRRILRAEDREARACDFSKAGDCARPRGTRSTLAGPASDCNEPAGRRRGGRHCDAREMSHEHIRSISTRRQAFADHRRQPWAGARNGAGHRRCRGRRRPGGPRCREPGSHGRRHPPAGSQAVTIDCDVGQPDACQEMCQRALADHGPIDILINNVGGRRINVPTAQLPLDKWQEIVHLNLTSTFLCTKLIGGAMVAADAAAG